MAVKFGGFRRRTTVASLGWLSPLREDHPEFSVVTTVNIAILECLKMKGVACMSLAKTWYTVEEAESNFGVPRARILQWVEEGLVRCEQKDRLVTVVNGDDLELKVEELIKGK